MMLSIIIPSFNTKRLLRQCLQSLQRKTVVLEDQEIIVVDNASGDESAEMVKKEFPKAKLIKNKENKGFSKAVNQGISRAKGDQILLLNSDIVVRPHALKILTEFLKEDKGTGVVGGQLLNPDKTVQGSCFYLPNPWRTFQAVFLKQKKFLQKHAPKTDKPVEVESVIGAVFLVSKEVMKKIGKLDERFFMYFEDLEYCRRVRKNGLKVFYHPQAQFIHHHGASGKKISSQTKQWLRQSAKIYYGWLGFALNELIVFAGRVLRKFR